MAQVDSLDRADIGGLARRGLFSLGGAAISAIASLLVIVVVTRGSGKTEAGNLFSATSLFVIAESLCALGTATGLVYYIARVRALDRGDGVRGLLRTALPPVIAVSVTVAVLMELLAPSVAGMISDGSDDTLVIFIRVLAPFLPCAVLFDVLIAGTQGFHTMTPTVLLEKIGRPTLQVALLLVAMLVGENWLMALGWVAPYAIGLVVVTGAIARLVRKEKHEPVTLRVVPPSEFWRYTGPRGIAAVAQLTLQRLDIVLVAAYLGPRDAAIYTAATRFVVLGQLGSQAVSLAVQPKFSELLAKHDLASTLRVYRTSTAWVMAVTWPIHLLVGILAPIILLLFGSGYDEGRWVVMVLAGAMLVATGCGMVTMLLVMAGRTTANLINVLVALGANLSLNLILIPRWGIVGAAVAWAVSILLSNILPLVQIRRSLGLDPFGRSSAAVALLAFAAFGAVPSIGWLLGGSPALVIGLCVVGVLLYGAGIWRLRRVLDLDSLITPVLRRLR
ncbi:polysaccharide biosynthesis C-terminal domain-containing protein [Microlunatus sp. Gsoil 973]|uniref:oligosaccharide flippase family protein n=1 Tax=Microlunatus sp. Gsoil 973 TaxID=2672569 RepID=UPI0012B47B59|nr:polysaccharide biosynthesis C-terminal domain-containing protein [Microlunatus sp. Gsoil 973]QGN33898.1 oligosaccharide flippase family protein [Microlunatus sp. Gsoil 973]